MEARDRVVQAFREHFAGDPGLVVHAPGRVNLIGEHTDYNDGFVLPIAIDRASWIAARPRDDRRVRVTSLEFPESAEFALDDLRRGSSSWGEYVKGVAWSLQAAGHRLRGWDGVLLGEVPIGAGLSSSASVELAVAGAFAAVSDLDWQPEAFARLAQRAENEWVGVRCGIMDQMASAVGQRGHALLIDCRSLAWEAVPLPPGFVVAVLDTGTRRALLDSGYNERRAQCEAVARHFGRRALRDVSPQELEREASRLEPVLLRRARHVIGENARTLEAAEAMRREDATRLGQLMMASHASLRDDFEVSSAELEIMVACARRQPGCYGARLTGAGFGGSAVALVEETAAPAFAERVAEEYRTASGREARILLTQAADGASLA
ncbi:MAG: galactokinase [Chloroflexota bacterium]